MKIKSELDLNINWPIIISLLTILSTAEAIIYQKAFLENLKLNWYLNVLDTQQIILSTISLLVTHSLGITTACIIYYIKEKIAITKKLSLLIFLIIGIGTFVSLKYIEIKETKDYILALGSFYGVLQTILTTEKGKSPITGVIATLAVIASWGYAWTETIKEEAVADSSTIIKNFEKKLPRVKIKESEDQWFLLRATGNELLIMQRVNKKIIYRGIAIRETTMITEQP